MATIVSSVMWVRRGKLAEFPRSEITEEAEAALQQETMTDEEQQQQAPITATTTTTTQEGDGVDVVKQYGLEAYDEEPEALMAEPYFANPEADPELANMDDASDVEETALLADDLFVLAATTDAQDEISRLDMHVFEERDRNMWVHHDYFLPAFPLCLAYVDRVPQQTSSAATSPAKTGNYVAVGTFEPAIEVWDLDVLDAVAPMLTLGGVDEREGAGARGTGKKKRKQRALLPGSHSDSVLSLSWNKSQPTLLASGSADHTVKVWDLSHGGEPVHTFGHHHDKVQTVEWAPAEPFAMLTVGFDRRVCVIDVRTEGRQIEWTLPADPETAAWIPQSQSRFLVGAEDGAIRCFDAATGQLQPPAWTIAAHDKAATALAVNVKLPGLIATGSLDRHVKLWSIVSAPSCIYSRDTCSEVFAASFSEDSEQLLALGTSSGARVWDVSDIAAVRRAFSLTQRQLPEDDDVDEQQPTRVAAASGDELTEVMPPGQGPEAERKKAEKQRKKQQKETMPAAAATAPPRPPPGAHGGRRVRFARPKFSPKKLQQ